MKKIILATVFCAFGLMASQNYKAYQFYNKNGKAIKTDQLVKDLSQYDVVFFGELHNNSIVHWLQLKLTESLYEAKKGQLTLGAEMFERDNQSALDQYLKGEIEAKSLKDSVRLWTNYKTDYAPLLDFAKTKQLSFIATNIPRKFASQVAKQGLESLTTLPKNDQQWMAQLPITVTLDTPGYPEMKSIMGEHADLDKVMNFVSAQAVKDATMAESILKNLKKGRLFLHYNGDFHSKQYGGIYWYIQQKNSTLKMAVISVFESEDQQLSFPETDYKPTEFNLIIPADMTKTY